LRFVGDATERFAHRFYRAVADPVVPIHPSGGALSFDGMDNLVEVSHQLSLNAYPLSRAAWV